MVQPQQAKAETTGWSETFTSLTAVPSAFACTTYRGRGHVFGECPTPQETLRAVKSLSCRQLTSRKGVSWSEKQWVMREITQEKT